MHTTDASGNTLHAGDKSQLNRVLGGGFAIAAGVGTIIGLGILRNPGEIAAVIPNPYAYVGLWVVAGLFVLVNISVAAELVGMTPRSGGVYVLVKRALGPFPGFLMGWVDWLSFPATIALKAVVFAEYLVLLIPALSSWNKVLALSVTTTFAILQMKGVAFGSRIQRIAAVMMSLILLGITMALLLAEPVSATVSTSGSLSQPGLEDFGLVLAAIVFTYDGWLAASYFGGEIKGGGRAVSLACIRGVLVILVLYIGLNAALAFSVPLEQLAGHELALSGALDLAWGEGSGTLILVAAILILMAHQNMNYLSAPRTLYALSLDGFGIGKATRVHSGGNPVFAVFLTWMVTSILILIGGFEYLLNLSALIFTALYVAVMAGVLILRKTEPEADRPYRAWGHPFSTIFCLVGWLLMTGFMAYTAPFSALSALIMTAVAIPVYFVILKLRHNKAS